MIEAIKKRFAGKYELYEVGGAVRDSFLHRKSNDIDFATNARPEQIMELVDDLGSVYPMGLSTIGVTDGKTIVEITTYRANGKYDLNSGNELGESIEQDLAYRDFTINAIARNVETGAIVDPFGGMIDIKDRIIRCVGDEKARLREDPLRMMRAIRFACQLNFKMDVRIGEPSLLNNVSKERIKDELSKILLSKNPSAGIKLLCDTGLMHQIIPEFLALRNVAQGRYHVKDAYGHSILVLKKGSKLNRETSKENELAFRLACLLHDISKPETYSEQCAACGGYILEGKCVSCGGTKLEIHFYKHQYKGARKARKILRRLHFSNRVINKTCNLIRNHMRPMMLQREFVLNNLSSRIVVRFIRKIGEDEIYDLLDLVECDISSSRNQRHKFIAVLRKMVNDALAEKPAEITSPINGAEIMKEFNLKPGKLVGELKRYLTELAVDGKLKEGDKKTALAYARIYLNENS